MRGVVGLVVYGLLLYCSVSEAAIALTQNVARELLHMDNLTDVAVSSFFVFCGYLVQYVVLGGLFEGTNPRGSFSASLPKADVLRRWNQVKQELRVGAVSLLVTVGLTMIWMFCVEPRTYFYAYFETRSYNIWWFLGSVLAYMFWFDTWFYWSHRWLHDFDFLWNKVHYVHHQFKEPSCFAQFSVHPIEAALQGPVGHYMATLFFPFHPVTLAIFGFLSSAWAIAAHDGRGGDFNSHYYHHSKGRGRHIYFNLGFLTPFWDWYCGTRWHEDHPHWVQWKERRGKAVFDTRDGTKEGQPNDAYGAYNYSLTALGIQEGAKKSN